MPGNDGPDKKGTCLGVMGGEGTDKEGMYLAMMGRGGWGDGR